MGIYSQFFPLQNAVCFIILSYLVPVLFTFYIHGVLKLKKKSGAKRLTTANLYFVEVVHLCVKVKVKVRFTLEQSTKTQKGSRCIAQALQPRR